MSMSPRSIKAILPHAARSIWPWGFGARSPLPASRRSFDHRYLPRRIRISADLRSISWFPAGSRDPTGPCGASISPPRVRQAAPCGMRSRTCSTSVLPGRIPAIRRGAVLCMSPTGTSNSKRRPIALARSGHLTCGRSWPPSFPPPLLRVISAIARQSWLMCVTFAGATDWSCMASGQLT